MFNVMNLLQAGLLWLFKTEKSSFKTEQFTRNFSQFCCVGVEVHSWTMQMSNKQYKGRARSNQQRARTHTVCVCVRAENHSISIPVEDKGYIQIEIKTEVLVVNPLKQGK
jgi:hypothetical protein